MRRAAFVYDKIQSAHVLRDDHVFKPSRLQLTYELLDSYGAFDDSKLVRPRMAEVADLLLFHNPDYVSAIRDLSDGIDRRDALDYNVSHYGDNPPYNGMYEASAMVVGASLTAADLVTGRKGNILAAVGGNVRNSVSKSLFTLTSKGRLQPTERRPWFVVLENRLGQPGN